MARSKPRKRKLEKVRQERAAQHRDNRARKVEMDLLGDVITGILRDHPPVKEDEPMGIDEIERWFDTDPGAPVILYSMPPAGTSFEDGPRIQISVNQNAIDRELKARGINESHPLWDLAQKAVGPTLRDTALELLEESISMMMEDDLLEDPPWVDVPSHQSGWTSSGERGWVSSDES